MGRAISAVITGMGVIQFITVSHVDAHIEDLAMCPSYRNAILFSSPVTSAEKVGELSEPVSAGNSIRICT